MHMSAESNNVSTPKISIDIGCGSQKKEGCIGLDSVAGEGVDYVIDLTQERWPFEDDSVSYVFSSHFLEHVHAPNHIFHELGRISRDGAQFEFWTPYPFSEGGFYYGHVAFLSESLWMEFCYFHRDMFLSMLGGRWLLNAINYVVREETAKTLWQQGFSIDFAIKHFKDVVVEFGIEIEFRRDLDVPARLPQRTYSFSRYGERIDLGSAPKPVIGSPPYRLAELEVKVDQLQSQLEHTLRHAELQAQMHHLEAQIHQLEAIIERKNNHIHQVEHLIQRIEAGRLMRLLKWMKQRSSFS